MRRDNAGILLRFNRNDSQMKIKSQVLILHPVKISRCVNIRSERGKKVLKSMGVRLLEVRLLSLIEGQTFIERQKQLTLPVY